MTIINNRCIVFFNRLDKLFLRAAVTRGSLVSCSWCALRILARLRPLRSYYDIVDKHLAKLEAKLRNFVAFPVDDSDKRGRTIR